MSYRAYLQILRVLHNYSCGYCGVTEVDTGSILTIDHYIPMQHGGTDELDNLIYCCHTCNRRKGDYAPSKVDVSAGRRLLHPRRDDATMHLQETSDGRIIALTPLGEFHSNRLDLNRAPLIAYRQKRRRIAELQKQISANQEILRQLIGQLQPLLDEVLAIEEAQVKDLEFNIGALQKLLKVLRESLP